MKTPNSLSQSFLRSSSQFPLSEFLDLLLPQSATLLLQHFFFRVLGRLSQSARPRSQTSFSVSDIVATTFIKISLSARPPMSFSVSCESPPKSCLQGVFEGNKESDREIGSEDLNQEIHRLGRKINDLERQLLILQKEVASLKQQRNAGDDVVETELEECEEIGTELEGNEKAQTIDKVELDEKLTSDVELVTNINALGRDLSFLTPWNTDSRGQYGMSGHMRFPNGSFFTTEKITDDMVQDDPSMTLLQALQAMRDWVEPPPEYRDEYSFETAMVECQPLQLFTDIDDVEIWCLYFRDVVFPHVQCSRPHSEYSLLKDGGEGGSMKVVKAELYLPTPLPPMWACNFLRWGVQIDQDEEIYAVIDLPYDSVQNCWEKQPSVILIRKCELGSEILWLQKRVREHQASSYISAVKKPTSGFSPVLNSELAFSAQRWVSALQRYVSRKNSAIQYVSRDVDSINKDTLLATCDVMKRLFVCCITICPKENWSLESCQGDFWCLMKSDDVQHGGSWAYIGLTRFLLKVDPNRLFQLLSRRNLEIQDSIDQIISGIKFEYEDVLNITDSSDDTFITVRKRVAHRASAAEVPFYIQEATKDSFCHYVISSPVDMKQVGKNCALRPSGYSILSDGSPTVVVTLVLQRALDGSASDDSVVQVMKGWVEKCVREVKTLVASL